MHTLLARDVRKIREAQARASKLYGYPSNPLKNDDEQSTVEMFIAGLVGMFSASAEEHEVQDKHTELPPIRRIQSSSEDNI